MTKRVKMSEIKAEDAASDQSRRRSRLEIYLDILRVISDGTDKPTRIMYGANLSWKPTARILGSMVSQGLISEIDTSNDRDRRSKRRYEITPKGENVARYFRRGREFLTLIEATHGRTYP